ncbi:hypothetical protein EW145_g2281 [Phellinidium pouzarii]|uniref:Peptide hydrolase n=1 Tax=Phellinidium pouzarii TaxID=167371 RepID=A0A4S4LDD2_9AGAM|nr:hypothetical protein EW145_g2281 [Phellinidium pouzarii]
MKISGTTTLLALAVTAASASQVILDSFLDDARAQHGSFEQLYQAHPGYNLDLEEKRLIQLGPSDPPLVLSEFEKIELKAQGVNFLDITDSADLGSYAHLCATARSSFPAPNATEEVNSVIKKLTTEDMISNLETFTSFRTRYYRSDITESFASESLRDQISIAEFPHSWNQNSIAPTRIGTSIVLSFESAGKEYGVPIDSALSTSSAHTWPFLPAPGARRHLTSVYIPTHFHSSSPSTGFPPGADDDGSGTMSILEAYRGLISAGFQPKRTVEFHFYSAEEGGLLGSQAVARDYESRGVNVIAMSQFDMTAWIKRGTVESIGIIVDFTDNGLTGFNKQLVEKYIDIPYVETRCGYACSDHASWSKAGYQAIFTIGMLIILGSDTMVELDSFSTLFFDAESAFEESNKYIHSGNDRIDISDEFSFEHMLHFSKLAAAFAIELGQWDKE